MAASARRLQTALGDLQDLHLVGTRLRELTEDDADGDDHEVIDDLTRQAGAATSAARSDLEEALREAVPGLVGGSRRPTTDVPEDLS